MAAEDIWTTNKYIKDPVGDGGMPRIPTIKTKDEAGSDVEINDNKEKAKMFTKAFFPDPPPPVPQAAEETPAIYSIPLPDPLPPEKQQLERVIRKLSPYKAPSPDGIPNIILQKCYDLIADYLTDLQGHLNAQRVLRPLEGVFYNSAKETRQTQLQSPQGI